MKKIIILLLLFLSFNSYSNLRLDSVWTSPNSYYLSKGKITTLLNQSQYSNWIAGGVNNLSLTLILDYDFTLKKGDLEWINRLDGAYGLVKNQNEDIKKNEDRIEIYSLIALKNKGRWSYSAFFNLKSQWSNGYKYSQGANGVVDRTLTTKFLSPAYSQVGVGMFYKKDDNFWFNYGLLSARYIMVNPVFTETLLDGENYFGVEKGESGRFEAGGMISAYYKKEIMKNMLMENKLNLFQNYLEDPLNIDVDYTLSLEFTINQFFSTNILLQILYDDNAIPEIQLKEVFGVSFNVNF
ncbi:MAG: DUF3078 domain-containing protein [Cytophagales bacterium]|nr:MAG: hypothetical protein CND83_03085 [Rhodothermaeota bacterium MED-G19]